MKSNGYYLKDIIPGIAVSTTAIDLYETYPQIKGQPCVIEVLTGKVYLNPKTVATTLNSNEMEGKSSIEVMSSRGLSVISDTSATMQIWILG